MRRTYKYFTLKNVFGVSACVVTCHLLYTRFSVWKNIQLRIRMTSHFRTAVALLLEHKKVLNMLGTPVVIGEINAFDQRRNYLGERASELRIPVCGTKDSGYLMVRAERNGSKQQFRTAQLELELDEAKRSIVFYDNGRWAGNLALLSKHDVCDVLPSSQFCCHFSDNEQ